MFGAYSLIHFEGIGQLHPSPFPNVAPARQKEEDA